jgi:hypothetical protein
MWYYNGRVFLDVSASATYNGGKSIILKGVGALEGRVGLFDQIPTGPAKT